MELLFANGAGKITQVDADPPNVAADGLDPTPLRKFMLILFEQCVNSGIVAGIAAFSLCASGDGIPWKPIVVAFGITFLTELRKFRGLIK